MVKSKTLIAITAGIALAVGASHIAYSTLRMSGAKRASIQHGLCEEEIVSGLDRDKNGKLDYIEVTRASYFGTLNGVSLLGTRKLTPSDSDFVYYSSVIAEQNSK